MEFIKSLEEKQKKVESELKEKRISIKFDTTLLEMISVFGKISVDACNDSSLPVVQYTGKVRPVVRSSDVDRLRGCVSEES